ncbi:flagellar hook capping FlgD N-terminal domain-containing protein [Natranaerobius trueperi]|uniref:Flagellar hook capping protein n=1 Tax=Natranaerobius trueperi TaxID=759412 RepID=A0A226BZ82_9FIRM|nr:flagellar hook capping FlgD N-terminal domain-containing protein [Natranaerobius trueperi]OWZ84231.1 flagellar hook capping protein [Natranaerobius trueperi]
MDVGGMMGGAATQRAGSRALPQIEDDQELGQEEFTEILVTQLQNQDPLDPMDDREFIVQITQFSQLEQLNNLNQNNERNNMMSMLGKDVVAHTEAGDTKQGLVTAVKNFGDSPTLEIDGEEIELSNIQDIKEPMLEQNTQDNK